MEYYRTLSNTQTSYRMKLDSLGFDSQEFILGRRSIIGNLSTPDVSKSPSSDTNPNQDTFRFVIYIY